MKESYCQFDATTGRYILSGRELHCGDTFEVFVDNGWRGVRIEMASNRWVLMGYAYLLRDEPDYYPARLYAR